MSLATRNSMMLPAFSRFFDDFFDREMSDWNNRNFSVTNTTLPAVNIMQDDDRFVVEMAAPGMEKKDFKIELNANSLIISSEKKSGSEKKDENYTRKEFSYQSFSRSFTLPEIVDGEKISAAYDKGVLKVTIPKKEEAKPKPPKEIEIK